MVNLLRDDYETVAEHVSRQIAYSAHRKVLLVQKNGRVSVRKADDYEGPSDVVLGVYLPTVRIEHLESDLLFRLREIRA